MFRAESFLRTFEIAPGDTGNSKGNLYHRVLDQKWWPMMYNIQADFQFYPLPKPILVKPSMFLGRG